MSAKRRKVCSLWQWVTSILCCDKLIIFLTQNDNIKNLLPLGFIKVVGDRNFVSFIVDKFIVYLKSTNFLLKLELAEILTFLILRLVNSFGVNFSQQKSLFLRNFFWFDLSFFLWCCGAGQFYFWDGKYLF